jgi:hypothetical protein
MKQPNISTVATCPKTGADRKDYFWDDRRVGGNFLIKHISKFQHDVAPNFIVHSTSIRRGDITRAPDRNLDATIVRARHVGLILFLDSVEPYRSQSQNTQSQ